MPQREYDWTTIDTPPVIGRHSLNKHQVLEEYLLRYLDKLYAKAHEYVRFSIIDGFAGGGIYKRGDTGELHFGSPILVMETVAKAAQQLSYKHGKKVELRARYYFVEKKPKYLSVLKKVLNEKGLSPECDGKGGVIAGSFTDRYDQIRTEITSEGRTHKALFVLDQYGYAAVPIQTIQQIFKDLPAAEVILTFAADWLIDYLSSKTEYIDRCQRRLDALGIGYTVQDLVTIKESTPYFRLLIQDLLSDELSKNCGAQYFTRYFIQTEDGKGNQSHRSIWLVHMSQHQTARDEMVKVHWGSANYVSTHAGYQGIDDLGLRGMGYSTQLDQKLGQLNLSYDFDASAEQGSIGTLLTQLPDLIWKKEQLTFAELMGQIANRTPVSSDIIKKVLDCLLASKDIEVLSEKGVTRKKGSSVCWTDIIKARHLSMFDYGNRP